MKKAAGPQEVYLIRHGQTEWSKSGQHTGSTDIHLTEKGFHQATLIKKRLHGKDFARVLCSPLTRAKQTCEVVGLLSQAEILNALHEWDYGDYEGLTTAEIRKKVPNWNVFQYPVPAGETAAAVGARADEVIKLIRSSSGAIAVFSHGHFSRVLAARWIDLPPEMGRHFTLDTATLTILGYEREWPVIHVWNCA